jgi:hypothetical protein
VGWDTYLEIDNCYFESWRKHAPLMPHLLFQPGDLRLSWDGEAGAVVWKTTAKEALENLHQNGFAWETLVADFAATRNAASGSLSYYLGFTGTHGPGEQELLRRLDELTPADELFAASQLLFKELHQPRWPSPEQLTESEPPTSTALQLFQTEETVGYIELGHVVVQKDAVSAARGLEYLLFLKTDIPIVAWPYLLVTVLRSAPPDAVLEHSISEAIEGLDWEVGTVADLEANARDLREGAFQYLIRTSGFYSGVLRQLEASSGRLARAVRWRHLGSILARLMTRDGTPIERGALLEDFMGELVSGEGSSLVVLEKRFRTAHEELDLILQNNLSAPFWHAFRSPLILVECKNWRRPVGVPELRVLESKVKDRGSLCNLGILVALGGVSREVMRRARALGREGITIFVLDAKELAAVVGSQTNLSDYLASQGIKRVL